MISLKRLSLRTNVQPNASQSGGCTVFASTSGVSDNIMLLFMSDMSEKGPRASSDASKALCTGAQPKGGLEKYRSRIQSNLLHIKLNLVATSHLLQS